MGACAAGLAGSHSRDGFLANAWRDGHKHFTVAHFGEIRRNRTHARLLAVAACAVEAERVQRADDLFPDQHSVRERPALVRAATIDCEHLPVARAEHRDEPAAHFKRAAEASGDVVESAEGYTHDVSRRAEGVSPPSKLPVAAASS